MANKKWLFINPPTGKYIRETRCQAPVQGIIATALRTPVELAYAAGAVSIHMDDCLIRDYPAECKSWVDFIKDLHEHHPEYLVVNTTTFTLDADMEACCIAKSCNAEMVTIARGAAFHANAAEVINKYKALDIAVLNDDEFSLGDVASGKPLAEIAGIVYRNGKEIIENPSRNFDSLDKLPKARRDIIDHSLYLRPDTGEKQTVVLVSRGCDGHCIYCVAPLVGGRKIRYRSHEAVIEEVMECIEKYGITNFYFLADNFTGDKAWVLEFCRLVLEKQLKISWLCNSRVDCIEEELIDWMKRAGCWGLSMGIESSNSEILDKVKKNITLEQVRNAVNICRKYKLVNLLHFMIGFPWDTKETIAETVRFAKGLKGALTEFNIVTPLPGTGLWKLVKDASLLEEAAALEGSDYQNPLIKSTKFSNAELLRLRQKAMLSIYFNPGFWLRSISHVNSLNQLVRCIAMLFRKLFWILVPKGLTRRSRVK